MAPTHKVAKKESFFVESNLIEPFDSHNNWSITIEVRALKREGSLNLKGKI